MMIKFFSYRFCYENVIGVEGGWFVGGEGGGGPKMRVFAFGLRNLIILFKKKHLNLKFKV